MAPTTGSQQGSRMGSRRSSALRLSRQNSRYSQRNSKIQTLDFDRNQTVRSHASSHRSLLDDDVDFMNEVAEGIIDRDRKKMRREVTRIFSFVCAMLCCLCVGSITTFSLYGHLFQENLGYSQFRINAVSVTGELAMYLPIPLLGYLCDRYSPPPLSLLGGTLFAFGYLLAAYTYKSGPPPDSEIAGGNGWPFGAMIIAFVAIGVGTNSLYIAAVATCAKNYATSKYRGVMLALPIAAVGLSGMWQSQVGANLLYVREPDGSKGDVDVFKYFVFLAIIFIVVGLLGAIGLRIVGEDELIEQAVEDLEQSGLLDQSQFFHHPETSYGTLDNGAETSEDEDPDAQITLSESLVLKKREEEEELKQMKRWVLDHALHSFLTDRTMWLLGAGFFLLIGPAEAYLNNFGTIIPSLTPRHYFDLNNPPAGHAATHVSLFAITSTFARLFTGTLSDIFAPSAQSSDQHQDPSTDTDHRPSSRVHFSRLLLLIPCAVLSLLAFLTLALPFLAPATPSLFLLTTTLSGLSYGGCFSLIPIIVSVVWGAENFATNWGIVAMMPAGAAALWSVLYSVGYSNAARKGLEGICHGYMCYGPWAWGSAASVTVAIVLWLLAARAWRLRGVVV